MKPVGPYDDILTSVSLFHLLQCIIQYDHRTSCKAPPAAPPQAQQASPHLDSDASQGVSPYLVRSADGACYSPRSIILDSSFSRKAQVEM